MLSLDLQRWQLHQRFRPEFPPYFNDTRLEAEICQTGKSVKGALLLRFVRLGGFGGLDMRFLGGK
jgi:hypothetical protein